MKTNRIIIAALGFCVLAGAAVGQTPKTHRHHHSQTAAAAPVAPAMPRTPALPPAVGPAPVPNESVNAPVPIQPGDPTVAPDVFQIHYPPQGEGYTTGSSPQAMDDRNAAKVTGVQMKLPLTQGNEAQPP